MSTRRIVFITLAALVLAVVVFFAYLMLTTRKHSPAAVVEYQQNGFDMQIDYCRPYKKGRVIFGTNEEGALLPHGQYWRLGANEATKLTLNTPISFGGKSLATGSYSLYAFPNEDHWVIGINSEADRWGAFEPDFSKDLGRVKVAVTPTDESLEQFTITIESRDQDAAVVMHWDKTKVEVPVTGEN